jgi:hypothetical protein
VRLRNLLLYPHGSPTICRKTCPICTRQ